MIRSTILTAVVLISIVSAGPSLLLEQTLASASQAYNETTPKRDGSIEVADATYEQQVENAHVSCQDVAKAKGFSVERLIRTNQNNDPTKGSVFGVYMELSRRGRTYRATCLYNPTKGKAHINAFAVIVP